MFIRSIYCCVLACYSNIALAEINEQTNYYSIVASSAQELDRQLSLHNRNGFYADTQWRIQPRYRFSKGAHGCQVAESNINLTITYTMPEWLNKQDASVDLQEKWNTWYSNLLNHEKTHGFNGRQAYNDIKQGIYLMASAPSCSQLTQTIKVMIDSMLFKYTQEDLLYDQRTRHGETEGASIQFSANK